MMTRTAHLRGARLLPIVLLGLATAGCASTPIYFPGIVPGASSMSNLPPDERIVIGQIQYANGDLTKWIKGNYQESWPRFTYNLQDLQGPDYDYPKRGPRPPFGPRGGVFAFRAKRQTIYLDSIMVATTSFLRHGILWTFPIMLKVPPTDDRCVFVGTIVVEVSGDHDPSLPWLAWTWESTGNAVHAAVVDTYDRDRAVLSAYVKGCDLQKALSEPAPVEEIDALLATIRAQESARNPSPHNFKR